MARKSKPAVVKMPSDEWRDAFKAFTMRPNFVLALSRSMLEFLCAVADDVHWDRATYGMRTIHAPDNWFATTKSLEKRGLIILKCQADIEETAKGHNGLSGDAWVAAVMSTAHYVLTPAGTKVVDLLKVTGMFIEQDNAIRKKHRA